MTDMPSAPLQEATLKSPQLEQILGDVISDEDLEAALDKFANQASSSDVSELLKTMDEQHFLQWEEARRFIHESESKVVKCGLPQHQRPCEPENTTDVDKAIARLYANDPTLQVVNINNMKRLPFPTIQKLMLSLRENQYLQKLSMANLGLQDSACEPLLDVLQHNSSLCSLNLETNYLSGQFLVRLFQTLLVNQSVEEVKVTNQGVVLGSQDEMDIADAVCQNNALVKVGLNFRRHEARNTVNSATYRNNELRRIIRQEDAKAVEMERRRAEKKEEDLRCAEEKRRRQEEQRLREDEEKRQAKLRKLELLRNRKTGPSPLERPGGNSTETGKLEMRNRFGTASKSKSPVKAEAITNGVYNGDLSTADAALPPSVLKRRESKTVAIYEVPEEARKAAIGAGTGFRTGTSTGTGSETGTGTATKTGPETETKAGTATGTKTGTGTGIGLQANTSSVKETTASTTGQQKQQPEKTIPNTTKAFGNVSTVKTTGAATDTAAKATIEKLGPRSTSKTDTKTDQSSTTKKMTPGSKNQTLASNSASKPDRVATRRSPR